MIHWCSQQQERTGAPGVAGFGGRPAAAAAAAAGRGGTEFYMRVLRCTVYTYLCHDHAGRLSIAQPDPRTAAKAPVMLFIRLPTLSRTVGLNLFFPSPSNCMQTPYPCTPPHPHPPALRLARLGVGVWARTSSSPDEPGCGLLPLIIPVWSKAPRLAGAVHGL